MKKFIFTVLTVLCTTSQVFAYVPTIPKSPALNANDINNADKYSPVILNRGFTVLDHIGVKDKAFNGERHIATKGKGIQWYGYDIPPYNDLIITNQDIPENYNINLKQSPIIADWHTINGSGVIFNAITNAPQGEVSTSSNFTFSGFALVATQDKIQLREYNTDFSKFASGTAEFKVITEIPKTCNSQSFNIIKTNNDYEIKLDNTLIYKGELQYYGNYVGAMVDYLEHNCESLSSTYMYNLTVNDTNLFEKKEDN